MIEFMLWTELNEMKWIFYNDDMILFWYMWNILICFNWYYIDMIMYDYIVECYALWMWFNDLINNLYIWLYMNMYMMIIF